MLVNLLLIVILFRLLSAVIADHGLRIAVFLDFFALFDVLEAEFAFRHRVGARLLRVRAAVGAHRLEPLVLLLLLLQVVHAEEAQVILAAQTLQDEVEVAEANRAVVLVLQLALLVVGQEVAAIHVFDFELSVHLDIRK